MGTLIAPLTNPRPLSIRPLPFYPDCLLRGFSMESRSPKSSLDFCPFQPLPFYPTAFASLNLRNLRPFARIPRGWKPQDCRISA